MLYHNFLDPCGPPYTESMSDPSLAVLQACFGLAETQVHLKNDALIAKHQHIFTDTHFVALPCSAQLSSAGFMFSFH